MPVGSSDVVVWGVVCDGDGDEGGGGDNGNVVRGTAAAVMKCVLVAKGARRIDGIVTARAKVKQQQW